MANIVFLQLNPKFPAKDYWDQTLLIDSLPNEVKNNEAIVVIPGAYQGHLVDDINKYLSKWIRCLVIITSDEEGKFPIDRLEHPNMTVWGSYMNDKYRVDKWLPIGYTPHSKILPKEIPTKTIDWFFAGQITHTSRRKLVEILKKLPNGELVESQGFSQGLPREQYIAKMLSAKYVPCPGGGVNIDSFRVYEALEAGCIPIAENIAFWAKLLPDAPFPTINDWRYFSNVINSREWNIVEVMSWWLDYKRKLKEELQQWTM